MSNFEFALIVIGFLALILIGLFGLALFEWFVRQQDK